MTLRYAAVGTEKREGVPLKWIAMQTKFGDTPEVGDGAKSSITETPREMPGLAAPAR